jgi:uncharacterized membrane protein
MLSLAHIGLSTLSLVLGVFIFVNTKGTRLHRWIGTLYAVSMVGLNLTALGIYNLTGHFNFFHFTAILSLAMVLVGWSQPLFRRRLRNWLYRHYVYMCWSYVALLAATFNEGFTRVTLLKALVHRAGNWVIIATQVILVCAAAFFINTRKKRVLSQLQYAKAT